MNSGTSFTPKIRGGSASEVASSRHDGAGSGGRAPEHPAPDEGLSITPLDEERQAVLGRLTAIENRELDERSLTPGEAHTIIAWIGELQIYGLKAVAREAAQRGGKDAFISTLAHHALVEIRCDHEAGTDTPACNCAVVALGSHPSVQAAKEAWAAHVWEELHRV